LSPCSCWECVRLSSWHSSTSAQGSISVKIYIEMAGVGFCELPPHAHIRTRALQFLVQGIVVAHQAGLEHVEFGAVNVKRVRHVRVRAHRYLQQQTYVDM
jgi:hypothetical protein